MDINHRLSIKILVRDLGELWKKVVQSWALLPALASITLQSGSADGVVMSFIPGANRVCYGSSAGGMAIPMMPDVIKLPEGTNTSSRIMLLVLHLKPKRIQHWSS